MLWYSALGSHLINYADAPSLSITIPELMNLSLTVSRSLLEPFATSESVKVLLDITRSLDFDPHLFSVQVTDSKHCHEICGGIIKNNKHL